MAEPGTSHPSPETSGYLHDLFPGIAPSWMRGADPCWIAWALAQTAEHNPPMYWLGQAFASLHEQDAALRSQVDTRLRAAHADGSCGGQGIEDDVLQGHLTEVCAIAWASERLGSVTLAPLVQDDAPGAGLLLRVLPTGMPDNGTVVIPRRLQPERSMEQVLRQVAMHAEEAATLLDDSSATSGLAARGILYLDIWHERRFAQSIGYRFEITEPVQLAVRHYAPAFGLGYVLTRPFEWGRPLEEWA